MPTYRNIWAGCYDVWYDEKDRIAQREIPRYRTQQMIEKGLIYKENITRVYGDKSFDFEIYMLTEKGKEVIGQVAER